MEDFSRLKADVILKKGSIDEYQKAISFFWNELVKLNTNIFIIKKIYEFPFSIFCSPGDTVFFPMVVENFYEYSVLIVTKLVEDKKGDVYTLRKFKKWIYNQVKPTYKLDFQNWLKKSKFDLGTEKILSNAVDLRKKIIAHFNKNLLFGKGTVKHLSIEELEKLRDRLNAVLDTLSFSVKYMMLPLPYNENVIHPKGDNHQTDIEALLDSVAKNSKLLDMPEDSPEKWKFAKESFNKEIIKILNKYRKRFNLPEV